MAVSKKILLRKRENKRSAGAAGKKARPLWELRLYVAGMTPTSIRAFENLKKLCEEHMHGAYKIHVIDLLERPNWPVAIRLLPCQPWSGICPHRSRRLSVTFPTLKECWSALISGRREAGVSARNENSFRHNRAAGRPQAEPDSQGPEKLRLPSGDYLHPGPRRRHLRE